MCTVENKVQCEIVHTCSGNSQLSNIISIIFLDCMLVWMLMALCKVRKESEIWKIIWSNFYAIFMHCI